MKRLVYSMWGITLVSLCIAIAAAGCGNSGGGSGTDDGDQNPDDDLEAREPYALSVADIDSDGNLDLVTVNRATDNVSVRLGNGDGTFAAGERILAGRGPRGVAIGLIDGDTAPDLVVANTGSTDISIFLGNGDGTFQDEDDATHYEVGQAPIAVAIGDVNQNGSNDIVVANTNGATVAILSGNGDGTFEPPPESPRTRFNPATGMIELIEDPRKWDAGAGPRALALVDLSPGFFGNTLEIITVNLYTSDLAVRTANITNASRRFWYDRDFRWDVGESPRFMVMGDVNGDAFPDAVTVSRATNEINVLIGGLFGFSDVGDRRFEVADNPESVALGDIDGDGFDDVVTTHANDAGDDVSVLLGNGDGTFGAARHISVDGRPVAVALKDVNNDGFDDLLTGNVLTHDVTVFLSEPDGSGTFQAEQRFGVSE